MANVLKQFVMPDEAGGHVVWEATVDTFAGLDNIDVGPTRLYSINVEIASGTDFLLMWDSIDPVVGTDPPDYQWPTVPDSPFVFPEGIPFENGLSFAVANVGGTVCSGDPSGINTITLLTKPG